MPLPPAPGDGGGIKLDDNIFEWQDVCVCDEEAPVALDRVEFVALDFQPLVNALRGPCDFSTNQNQVVRW